MDKIKLRLCAGTMCYVMGGAQLMEIEELLSEEEKQGIEITFSPCLQRCNGKDTSVTLHYKIASFALYL